MKENSDQNLREKEGYFEIKYILYYQKQLISFIGSLALLIEQLFEVEYEAASQLEIIFVEAVKESKFFLPKY